MERKFYHECLGKQLRQIRMERRIRQADLAQLSNLSRLTVRGIESGKGNLSSFFSLIGVLGLDVNLSRCPAGSNIGERLARIRQRRQVSQRYLASEISVSHPTIVKLEKHAQGRLSTLNAALSFLGAKPKLLDGNRKKTFRHISKSSATDEWYTPADLLKKITDAVGTDFDLDPCSPTLIPAQAPVAATRYYTTQQDGLSMKWQGRVYMNPPYAQVKRWVEKARFSVENEYAEMVVGLVAARTDTRWWNDNVAGYAEVFFLRGRITFSGHINPAPFPSAVVIWGDDTQVIGRMKSSLNAYHMPSDISISSQA